MKKRILLVEDEIQLAKGLRLNFELEGHEVAWAANGAAARRAHWPPICLDLVVLDVMLPDVSGFQLLQEAKRMDMRLPVLVLTACAGDEDRIMGLSLGADDYLTKPFNLEELILRVRGMLRRGEWYQESLPGDHRPGRLRAAPCPVRTGTERVGHPADRTGTGPAPAPVAQAQPGGQPPGTAGGGVGLRARKWRPGRWTSSSAGCAACWGTIPEAPRKLQTLRGQGYLLVQEDRQDSPSRP